MQSIDRDVLDNVSRWLADGHEAWLYTVVRTWGSSPRPLGAMMALCDDGRIVGSISGGCVEDDIVAEFRRTGPPGPLPGVLEYGLTADEAHRFGLPCGGTLRIVRETVGAHSGIEALCRALQQGRLIRRTLCMHTGRVIVVDAASSDSAIGCRFDGETLCVTHGPTFRLLLIGAGQLTQYVASMAVTLDYAVTVCDPRIEYLDQWTLPEVALARTMPDDTVIAMCPDMRTAVIALTHDPKLDDLALIEALMSPAFYVGAIGSRRNSALRRERLQLFGVSAEGMAKLHAPVGLYLGGSTPPEIAVSIVAELTACRHSMQVNTLADVETGKAIEEKVRAESWASI